MLSIRELTYLHISQAIGLKYNSRTTMSLVIILQRKLMKKQCVSLNDLAKVLTISVLLIVSIIALA